MNAFETSQNTRSTLLKSTQFNEVEAGAVLRAKDMFLGAELWSLLQASHAAGG